MSTGILIVPGVGQYEMGNVYETANLANDNTVPSIVVLDEAFSPMASLGAQLWQQILSPDGAARDKISIPFRGTYRFSAYPRCDANELAVAQTPGLRLAHQVQYGDHFDPVGRQLDVVNAVGKSLQQRAAHILRHDGELPWILANSGIGMIELHEQLPCEVFASLRIPRHRPVELSLDLGA